MYLGTLVPLPPASEIWRVGFDLTRRVRPGHGSGRVKFQLTRAGSGQGGSNPARPGPWPSILCSVDLQKTTK